MQLSGAALARRHDILVHAVRFTDGAVERLGNDGSLMVGQGLGIRDDDGHPQIAASRPEHTLRERVERRGVAGQRRDLVASERVEVVRDEIRREVERGEVELVRRGVPDPERGTPLGERCDQLTAQPGPRVARGHAVPAPRAGARQAVQLPQHIATLPH